MPPAFASPPFPDEAIEYAGFVLAHCALIADNNRQGELICPFAVLADSDGRQVVDFEAETQQEAVAKGWASLADAKAHELWWAFGREGITRKPDGAGKDVLIVTVWTPGMPYHHTVLQNFARSDDQGIYLLEGPRALKHAEDLAEDVAQWNLAALERGIASHPRGARWPAWKPQ